MRNRAKCKLCNDVLESFLIDDTVVCSCGEISISGGEYRLLSSSRSYKNFLRIEDDGSEKPVKYIEEGKAGGDDQNVEEPVKPLTKKELINVLENKIKSLENLPPNAMTQPTTHYDLYETLLLLISIVRSS